MRRSKGKVAICLLLALVYLIQIPVFAAYNTVPTKKYPTMEGVEMLVTPDPEDSSLAGVELHLNFSNNVGCIDETQAERYNMEGYNQQNLTKFHLTARDENGVDGEKIEILVTPHPDAAKHQDTSKFFYIYADGLSVDQDYVLTVDEDLYANMGNSLGVAYEVPFHIGKNQISFAPLGDLPETDVTVALFFEEASIPNNAKNIALMPEITMTFSNNIAGSDVLTYNAACFYLVSGTQYLDITVTAGPDVRQLIVRPKEPLEYETEYRIIVVKELMARNGSTLSSPVNLYFTTRTESGELQEEEPELPQALPEDVYFSDIAGNWAVEEINYLADLGVVNGRPDGSFAPNSGVTRAEVSAMLVRAFDLTGDTQIEFTDTAGHWAEQFIRFAAAAGVVTGREDQSFAPDIFVTREELALLLTRVRTLPESGEAIQFLDGDTISAWALEGVNIAGANKIVQGRPDGTFRPHDSVTRAEACKMIVNLLKLPEET